MIVNNISMKRYKSKNIMKVKNYESNENDYNKENNVKIPNNSLR